MSESSFLIPVRSIVQRLKLQDLFQNVAPVELELGSGDGSFLAAWAQAHPEINFLGVERLLGRLKKLDRKTRRLGLRNVRLIRIEAFYLLKYLLPAASLSAIHVYFPDPWPKRRHRSKRLINQEFVNAASQALRPSGKVWLRTDNQDYFEQMLETFRADARFGTFEPPAELAVITTDFERGFNAQGIPTLRAGFELVNPSV